MKTTKTAAEKIAALTARNARADLIEVATLVLGLTEKTAAGLPGDMLLTRFAKDGFSEDEMLMALIDDHGFHPMGVNELCLSSMIALWLECIAPAPVAAANPARKPAAPKTKTAKLAPFQTATQLFGLKEAAVKAAKITAARTAREQDMRQVAAFQRKYAMPGQGPRDIIFGMIQAGKFTKQQIRAAVLEAFPAIKANYLNTQMARTTNPNSPAFKQVAKADSNGILTWAY